MARRWIGWAIGGVGVVALVGGAAVVVPRGIAAKLRAAAEAELTRRVDADVTFTDLTVDVWSAFPRVDAVITGLRVANRAPFDGTTLLAADALRVGVDLSSLLGGPVGVRAVAIRRPTFTWVTDAEGRSNLDIWKPTTTTADEAAAWSVDLDAVDVTDLHVEITDAAGLRLVLDDVDHHLTGRAASDRTTLATTTTAGAVTYGQLGVTWLRDAKLSLDADVDVVSATGALSLTKGKLAVNALTLTASGAVVPGPDGVRVDGAFETADTSFATLLSLVPGAYGPAFAGIDVSGTLGLSGKVAGVYASDGSSYPSFEAGLAVVGGSFRYPGLPVAVEGVQLAAEVTHPEGPIDGVVLNVPDARLTIDERTVVAGLRVAYPLSDPEIDARAQGTLDLARLGAAFPEGWGAAGLVAGKVSAGGRWSDFVGADVAAIEARGDLRAEGLEVAWASLAAPVVVEVVDLSLDDNAVELRRCAARTGPTDAAVTGRVDHLIPWLLGSAPLGGRLDVASDRIDLDHLWAATDAVAAGVATVPTDLSLTIGLRAGEVISSGISAKNVAGTVALADGVATFERLGLDTVGGRVVLSGTYAAPTAAGADLDVDVDARSLDVATAVTTFTSLSKVAPVLATATGRFDALARVRGALGPDGGLVLPALTSDGRVDSHGVVMRPEALGRVAKAVGDPSLDRVAVDGGRLRYRMAAGKLEVSPVAIALGATPAELSGLVDVPAEGLDLALGFSTGTKGLGDLAIGAVGDHTDVIVRLVGPWADPKVKVELPGVKDVVDAAKAEVRAALSDAVVQAAEEGERLIAAAERAHAKLVGSAEAEAKKLRAEAKKQGAKLEADATNPIAAAAAKEARKKLEQKADAAGKRLVGEADAVGKKGIDEARAKKAALVEAATK